MSTRSLSIIYVMGIMAVATFACEAAAASSVVQVQLLDRSTHGELSGMKMKTDQQEIKAGRVSFQVTNLSKTLVHEMVVVKVDRPGARLPYDPKNRTVTEDKVRHLGEVAELKPGARGTLNLMLQPGSYLLVCNQPGHYHAGMYSPLTVTP